MKVIEIINRANACLAQLPTPTASQETQARYGAIFARMLKEPALDPLRPGYSRADYYVRRAALYGGAYNALAWLVRRIMADAKRHNIDEVQLSARAILFIIDAVEGAVAIDPPALDSGPNIAARSRWSVSADPKPKPNARAKKHVLAALAPDWIERLWAGAHDWKYRMHLAVAILVPIRPADMAATGRVVIDRVDDLLRITICAAKSRSGLAGTGTSTIVIDPKLAHPAAHFLAEACVGGPVDVRSNGRDGLRKALTRLSTRALPDCAVVITPYVLRAQAIADLKKTFGAGEQVAIAASHGSDKTQACYGRSEHGRARGGYVSFHATRKPKSGNVQRAFHISAGRKLGLSRWS